MSIKILDNVVINQSFLRRKNIFFFFVAKIVDNSPIIELAFFSF